MRSLAPERVSLDAQYVAAYEQLRRLASRVARREPHTSLNPTALVHEAWMKLAKAPGFEFTSLLHFRRIATRAMRQVLVEAARRRRATKRPQAADAVLIDLDATHSGPITPTLVLALDDALKQLALLHRRQSDVVEARFFGGLSVAETSELLGVSEVTVMRDWRLARAWLTVELNRR